MIVCPCPLQTWWCRGTKTLSLCTDTPHTLFQSQEFTSLWYRKIPTLSEGTPYVMPDYQVMGIAAPGPVLPSTIPSLPGLQPPLRFSITEGGLEAAAGWDAAPRVSMLSMPCVLAA